ncbi:MAG: hypothetical protein IPN38_15985 [Flavobacteriales bacterium]|nr:hypothetical protein [Flavobacteriales bacterium]
MTLRDKRTGDSLLVVNSHWDHVGIEARTHSAELLLSELHPARRNGVRVILMGDFNATANDSATLYLAEHLLDPAPRTTMVKARSMALNWSPRRLTDDFRLSRELEVLGYSCHRRRVGRSQMSIRWWRIQANE